jgi:hypothetical protein
LEAKQHIAQQSGVIEEISEEIKQFLEFNKNETQLIRTYGDTAKAALKGKFI